MSPDAELSQNPREPYAPLVSIITPTFQHERFIHSCLRSVLAQDYGRWELIVIDDASTDRTAQIVESYARRDSRIRLVQHQTNYGTARLADTYNEALAHCAGDLIAILEGDDEWRPKKLSAQVHAFQETQVILCYGDYDQVTADGLFIARHGVHDAVGPATSS